MVGLSNGPETSTVALCFGDYNQPAPDTFADAMKGTNGARVHIVSQCNQWKAKQCQFLPASYVPSIDAVVAPRPVRPLRPLVRDKIVLFRFPSFSYTNKLFE